MKPANLSWAEYARMGIGGRLSRLGERWGMHWLIYNPIHFRHFHDLGLKNAPGVMTTFSEVFSDARRYVDVGCGSGAFAAEALRRGQSVAACEHSAAGRRWARRQGVDCRPLDLNKTQPSDLTGSFDLAYCFEVAEHLPPALGDRLVEYLVAQAPLIVFTAAKPGQGGTGHINEQPKSYWIERFEMHGAALDAAASEAVMNGFRRHGVESPWMVDNVIVLRRQA